MPAAAESPACTAPVRPLGTGVPAVQVGVLALQGDFASHRSLLESLGARVVEVRREADLAACDALVIPGGESTVLTRHLMEPGTGPGTDRPWVPSGFFHALKDFGKKKPVMGTCAGLIMLARPCGDERVVSLDLLPVRVERNGFGRQTESFVESLDVLGLGPDASPYPATFIRAPRIIGVEPGVEVLAWARGHGIKEAVMVRYGTILGLSFHPELTPGDTRIHRAFLSMLVRET